MLTKDQNGIAFTEVLIAFVACLVIVLLGLMIEHKAHSSVNTNQPPSSTSNTANGGNANQYTVLAPATVPSKTAECTQQISFTSGGNSGPVTCSNGDLNVTEWNALNTLEPKVLTLGYGATSSQVSQTLCSDVSLNVSNPIEETAYQIASLYYGWHFSNDPSAVINNGTCKNQDD